MKRVLTSALLLLAFGCLSFGKGIIAEGKSHTPMGKFRIETADKPLVVDGVPLKTFVISYENSGFEVTVAISKEKNCKKYITVSDKLAVQYVCHGNYFGVERLNGDQMKTTDAALNRNAYFHQKVITDYYNDEVTCMMLIGAYYPELLKS